jgi:hypothetical protein
MWHPAIGIGSAAAKTQSAASYLFSKAGAAKSDADAAALYTAATSYIFMKNERVKKFNPPPI